MSDDDDLFVIGAEPGIREDPGSRRRRAFYEDDGLLVHGGADRAVRKRSRRPTGLWEYWLMVIEPALFTSPTQPVVARPVFNKHISDMRISWTDREIMDGMLRFADAVVNGELSPRRNAWLTFYGRRRQFVGSPTEVEY